MCHKQECVKVSLISWSVLDNWNYLCNIGSDDELEEVYYKQSKEKIVCDFPVQMALLNKELTY